MWALTKWLTTSSVVGPFWLKFLIVLVDMGGKCHVMFVMIKYIDSANYYMVLYVYLFLLNVPVLSNDL
jgi:hypothetical protein